MSERWNDLGRKLSTAVDFQIIDVVKKIISKSHRTPGVLNWKNNEVVSSYMLNLYLSTLTNFIYILYFLGVSAQEKTPLWYAADKGNLMILKLLIESGAQINLGGFKGQTPLWASCRHGHIEIVKLLISSGADKDMPCTYGWTPLLIA
jgi:ankyrin repeat protein